MYGTVDDENDTIRSRIDSQTQGTAANGNGGSSARTISRSPSTTGGGLISASGSMKKSSGIIFSHCHVQDDAASMSSGHNSEHSNHNHDNGVDKSARRRLVTASIVCLVFMIAEIIGGVLSNSLAIATDAAHLLTDFASFMISLLALWLSSRPATRRMSFGWYRAEVIGALLSVLMIWFVTGLLVYLAIERLRTQQFEIDAVVMVITASAGLLVNIIMACALHSDHGHGHSHSHGHLHGHSHKKVNPNDERAHLLNDLELGEGPVGVSSTIETRKTCPKKARGKDNINVRAALIHVIGDFIQSVGVLVAALVIYFRPDYAIVDPICTFIFSVIVLITTITIIRDAINVLMEGMPDGINFIEVRESLNQLEGIERVHNLRIWSLSLDKIAISAHLVIDDTLTTSQALQSAVDMLKAKYDFFEITIQIEEFKEKMKDCQQCQSETIVTGESSTNNTIS